MKDSSEESKVGRILRRIIFAPPDGDCKLGLSLSGIRRSPQCLRQSLNLSTATVDDEFEKLLDDLDQNEAMCKEFIELFHHYQTCLMDLLQSSFKVGTSMKQLFHLQFGDSSEILVGLEELSNCKRYISIIEESLLSLKDTFSTIPQSIDTGFYHILGFFDTIRKNIRKRDMALLDYDKVLDKFDPISIKKSTGTLSIKQSQHYHSIERQVDHYKSVFDNLNNMLKTELPYFSKLVSLHMDLMLRYIFYLQLTNTYQVNMSLLTLGPPMKFLKEEVVNPEFSASLIGNCAVSKLNDPDLNIISFHKLHLELLVYMENAGVRDSRMNFDPYFNYCIALFNFSAQSMGDLNFQKGEIIKVILSVGEWWQGELGDAVGMFPSNYVKMMTK